jgi:DNA-binding CsgD family transcriptional regulator
MREHEDESFAARVSGEALREHCARTSTMSYPTWSAWISSHSGPTIPLGYVRAAEANGQRLERVAIRRALRASRREGTSRCGRARRWALSLEAWGTAGDAAALVESMHRVDLDGDAWLDAMIAALQPVVPGAMVVLASSARWRDGEGGMQHDRVRSSNPALGRAVVTSGDRVEASFAADFFGGGGRLTLVSEALECGASSEPLARLMSDFGVGDVLNLTAMISGPDGGHGLSLAVASATPIALRPEARETFDGYAAHLSAAYRLRTAGLAAPSEGVVAPDGTVLHAEGEARDDTARDALRHAVLAVERARRADRRTDAAALLEAWRAIYERRWTLVETVESDGRRFFVARVNPPSVHAHPGLSPREQQIAALLGEGVPQKAIGYELELSPSTVAFHTANITRKLGARSATDAVRLLSLATRRRSRASRAEAVPGLDETPEER